ncbi:hypothetical protein KSF78_0001776 [Schistosoma japonicum]|nr:hypothetical protein KSF78_0001776 [Schistosoma japonicum]
MLHNSVSEEELWTQGFNFVITQQDISNDVLMINLNSAHVLVSSPNGLIQVGISDKSNCSSEFE